MRKRHTNSDVYQWSLNTINIRDAFFQFSQAPWLERSFITLDDQNDGGE